MRNLFQWFSVWLYVLPIMASGGTTVFFDSNQVATLVSAAATSDTIASEGYLFTCTRDKLFTGGIGLTNPIGRAVRIPWPNGVEAQAVTAGPSPGAAKLVIERVDGGTFALTAFTARLLANTAATGASIEIMPKSNGEDAFNDPVFFDASGYYGSSFSYDTSPNLLGSTAVLTNFDTYAISLFVDYALTALTVETIDESPALQPVTITSLQQFETTNVLTLAWTNAGIACLLESSGVWLDGWRTVTNRWTTNENWVSTRITNASPIQFFRLRGL